MVKRSSDTKSTEPVHKKSKKAPENVKSKLEKPNKPKFDKKNGFKNQNAPQEPTDWAKLKQEKKELKLKRKKSKNFYEVIIEAKKIGELLRRKNLKGGDSERKELTDKLHELLGGKGQYVKLVVAHDMARIVQYLLKFGSVEIREEVAKELIPSTVELVMSKYAKFTVEKMLKYGNAKTRKDVIDVFLGNIMKLSCHLIASHVLANAYATWATPQQKQYMQQEFYGDMYKQSKDNNVHCIADAYKSSPDMKAAILGSVKANLQKVFTKELLDNHLVHAVLADYLNNVSDSAEIIGLMASHAVVLANSKDGAKVVMKCIWNGTNKDKKTIMKALKEHIKDLCCHETAHTVVLAVLDAVDDTVLLNKVLVSEIVANSATLAKDEWGRKVLLWLVAPADPHHFHPTFIEAIKAGYNAGTSKKSPEIRRRELVVNALPALLKQIKDGPEIWFGNSSIGMVTLAVVKAVEYKSEPKVADLYLEAVKSLTQYICNTEWTVSDTPEKGGEPVEIAGIEHAGLHMVLKKLAQHDKEILAADEKSIKSFGEVLIDSISEEVLEFWITKNRACFILVAVFESNSSEVQETMKNLLEKFTKSLKKQTFTGAKILLKKLNK